MAKVQIDGDSVDIQVSLLERVMLAERPRKLPLSRIRKLDPHPPLLDMMVHWSDQSGVWLCGVSAYDGHMIPSSRHPGNTLAIELDGDEAERIYVEIDDESPAQAAERISRACGEAPTEVIERHQEIVPGARESSPGLDRISIMKTLEVEWEDEDDDVQLRDPLMQGSIHAPPLVEPVRDAAMRLDDDRDLSRLGGWLVGLGSAALVIGGVLLASGALPGLLALGAGATCAALGGVALAVVAHHQD